MTMSDWMNKGVYVVIGQSEIPEFNDEGDTIVFENYREALQYAIECSRFNVNQDYHVWQRVGPTINTTANTHIGGNSD